MKNFFLTSLLSLCSIVLTLLALELVYRLYADEFRFHNFIEGKRHLMRSAYPSEFHKTLGWIPKEGDHPNNIWNTKVTILRDGIRSNGREHESGNDKTILAVGDSFTFGDEVSDSDSWPAMLEQKSGLRVINGGVFGYGVDQIYLRMLDLASRYVPDIVVFSFIPADILRCEYSQRTSVAKPYFDISKDNELVFMNEHIPPQEPDTSLDMFRSIMGYSFLAHKLASRINPEYWLQGSLAFAGHTKVHSKGTEVSCLIFERLNHFAHSKGIQVYVLIQYNRKPTESDYATAEKATACIDENSVTLIDLRPLLTKIHTQDPDDYERLFRIHMTKEGNDLVASLLWKKIGGSLKREGAERSVETPRTYQDS